MFAKRALTAFPVLDSVHTQRVRPAQLPAELVLGPLGHCGRTCSFATDSLAHLTPLKMQWGREPVWPNGKALGW